MASTFAVSRVLRMPIFSHILAFRLPVHLPVMIPVRSVQLPAGPGAAAGGLAAFHPLQHVGAAASGRLDQIWTIWTIIPSP
jgi:hypothetical protein